MAPRRRDQLVVLWCALAAGCSGHATEPTPTHDPTVPAPVAESSRVVVEHLAGDVRVRAAGSTRWVPATAGLALAAGDAIQALAGASATLRIEPAGSEVTVESGTTLLVPEAADGGDGLRPLTGHVVARVQPGQQPLALQIPPGTLVLTAGARGGSAAEASIDVREDGSSVEMVEGQAEVVRRDGGRVAIHAHRWAQFDATGEPAESGASGPVAVLVEPTDGASVTTRGSVTLRWESLPGADAYHVRIVSGESVRRIETVETSVETSFAPGDHRWTVSGGAGEASWPPAPEWALHVEVDHTPPPLVLTSPAEGEVLTSGVAHVAGQTEPLASVEAGAARARADARGTFRVDVPVRRGLTNLVVRVVDASGNSRSLARSVVWP